MKGLILVKEEHCRWLREFIVGSHPAMVPLCNKPLLEYLLEFSVLCGVEKLRFVFDAPDESIEQHFGSGSRWGVEISYSPAREEDDLLAILKKNSGFCGEEPLLILEGFFFIGFDKNGDYSDLCTDSSPEKLECQTGTIRYQQGQQSPVTVTRSSRETLSLHPLASLDDVFTLSMNILCHDAHRYVVPGYSNEAGVFVGRNVIIPKTTTLNKPLLLGNNVQLSKNCIIGPGAIIGNNVIIDSGTQITNSIILDNTYVGAELTLKEKIVQRTQVISTGNGKPVHFVDQHLFSGVRNTGGRPPQRVVLHWLFSLLFYLMAILPALACRMMLKKSGDWQEKKTRILLADGFVQDMQQNSVNRATVLGRITRGFALDKVFLLPLVLQGKIDLVGNKPLAVTPKAEALYDDFDTYLPGVFYFSEAENIAEGDFQEEITERFFSANRSFLGDVSIIFKTLVNRWIP